MVITHDHTISVIPNDAFGRRYIQLIKESCERKGYPCIVTKTTMVIKASWQEGFIHDDEVNDYDE